MKNSKFEIRNSKYLAREARIGWISSTPNRVKRHTSFRISDFERSEATQATHLFHQKNGQFRIFPSP
jgi:hypothetical protein